ncbi:MAG: 2-oxoacid:acceptor oxidoreductase subunit alpha [Candidatus Omnitrophota bacterium]
MDGFSILIGGKAGFGIDKSGAVIGRLLNKLGFRIFIYRDYPSVIRGGHTFSIIRAANNRIAAHRDKVDLVLALNQETLQLHKNRLRKGCFLIFDSEQVKTTMDPGCGLGLPLGKILKEENAPEIMRNTCIIGAMAKAVGVSFDYLAEDLKKEFTRETDLNLKVAQRGFNEAKEWIKIGPPEQVALPLLTGNQAMALGLIKGGLDTYIAYPMTPSSPILHYLAEIADDFALNVIHPESEIGVILMALGFSYMGKKTAVGTSGGGFCLMTEGLSLSGMSELPIVIVLGQRPGPSTGLPTYSSQTDLHFALHAGQGEFTRFIVAPGDAEEAYGWSAVSLNLSWKYQIPSIILSDKNLGEGVFNFDIDATQGVKAEVLPLWDRKLPYKRYLLTGNGVSPLAFAPSHDAVIKVNSYEHDELGFTTEDPKLTTLMQEKRLRKEKFLAKDLESMKTVNVYEGKKTETALLCWGSTKGVCVEVAQELGCKVIQPIVLNPFPVRQFQEALKGVKRIICVENNATGQLLRLIKGHGFNVNATIFKYDGRPFSIDELKEKIKANLGRKEGAI